jgi:glycine cleavage system H lipoate-binding protein
MFGLFQEKLGEVVYVQLPEVGTEVELGQQLSTLYMYFSTH